VVHYHRERNHRGLGNQVIDGVEVQPQTGRVQRASGWVASSVITIGPRSPTAQGARRNCWTLRHHLLRCRVWRPASEGNIDRSSTSTAKAFDTDPAFMVAEIVRDEMYFNAISRLGEIVDSGVVSRAHIEH
jgi:hypothetical protein